MEEEVPATEGSDPRRERFLQHLPCVTGPQLGKAKGVLLEGRCGDSGDKQVPVEGGNEMLKPSRPRAFRAVNGADEEFGDLG